MVLAGAHRVTQVKAGGGRRVRGQKARGAEKPKVQRVAMVVSYSAVVVQHSFLSFQHIEQRIKRCPSGTPIWDVSLGQQLLHSRGFIGFQGVSRVFKGFQGVEGVEGVEGLEGA